MKFFCSRCILNDKFIDLVFNFKSSPIKSRYSNRCSNSKIYLHRCSFSCLKEKTSHQNSQQVYKIED